MANEIEQADSMEESPKERKKREKEEKKRAKAGGFDATVTDQGAMYLDGEEEDENSLSMALITMFIVIIWLAILGLLIKLDVGGFGSGILYPVLKDVPVLNGILPQADVYIEEDREFTNLNDAVKEIERLRTENEELKVEIENGASSYNDSSEEINALKEEIKRLKTFEDSQIEFQKLKTEFYEEVVFADEAPDIANYMKFYEDIDPDNAAYLYKQVVQQTAADKELEDYVKTYSSMKPKSAAAVFEQMTDNLDLVCDILTAMDVDARAKIMNVIDPDIASKLTKMMDPE